MRFDSKGIPNEIKNLDNREERFVLHVFDSDKKFFLHSSSYRTLIRKGLAKGIFVVLNTLHDEVRATKDERRKPDIHKLYDHTKGGIDIADLILASCTTRIKNKR